ncbi:uncharacterized protein M421DRAFT_70820, partial [Didymella exigua CBS 183.55]
LIARKLCVASIVGQTIESARITAASQDTTQAFLELFERTRIKVTMWLRSQDRLCAICSDGVTAHLPRASLFATAHHHHERLRIDEVPLKT